MGFRILTAAGAVVWPAPDYGSVAESVRGLFRHLDLDPENPLGRWIRPGMTVAIKPNWVKHEFGETLGRDVLFTHASVVRVLIDAAWRALHGDGRIVVADAPLQGCDFERLRLQNGIAEMEQEYRGKSVAFLDLRRQAAAIDDASSFVHSVRALPGDPLGYSSIEMGARSRLVCFGVNARFGVSDYAAESTRDHHHGAHRYLVSNSILSADVILNVPKLKTHMKTGMTGALKNFVGIIGSKDCLPHFRAGSPQQGGDEYPDRDWVCRMASPVRSALQSRAPLWMWRLARGGARLAPAGVIHGGGWYGNDTLWRTVHDLVDIAHNYDAAGPLRARPRAVLTLVDAIVAGEGCGPLKPRPRHCGCLVWGEDPGAVDIACAGLMGFDWRRIPLLSHLRDPESLAFSGCAGAGDRETDDGGRDAFAAPAGWAGRIEAAAQRMASKRSAAQR